MRTLPEGVTAEMVAGHKYLVSVDGHQPSTNWPGVSEILTEAGFGSPRKTPTQAMALGSIVHDITAGADRLRMNGNERLVPEYLDRTLTATDASGTSLAFIEKAVWAWESFLEDNEYTVEAVEALVVNPVYGYAGTIDRLLAKPDGRLILVDIKTGKRFPTHALQLAAYREALAHAGILAVDYAFYTDEPPETSWHRFDDIEARAVFRAAVTLYQWRKSHKLL